MKLDFEVSLSFLGKALSLLFDAGVSEFHIKKARRSRALMVYLGGGSKMITRRHFLVSCEIVKGKFPKAVSSLQVVSVKILPSSA